MLSEPPIEKLLPKVENRYVLAMLTAKRARQLVDGAQALSEKRSANHITQASIEIEKDKVISIKGEYQVSVPLRPEVEAERLEAQRQALEKAEEARMEERKYQDPTQATKRERREKQKARTDAFMEQNARDFTAQLLEIIGKQDEGVE